MSGNAVGEREACQMMLQDNRKVMAKRAAAELKRGDIVNLGFGVPAGVGNVLYESGQEDRVVLSLEQGIIDGVPATGTDFGIALILVLFYARPTSLTGMMEVVWIRQFFLLQNLMKKEM